MLYESAMQRTALRYVQYSARQSMRLQMLQLDDWHLDINSKHDQT